MKKISYAKLNRSNLWSTERKAESLELALRQGDVFLEMNPDGTQRRLISGHVLQSAGETILHQIDHLREIYRLRGAHAGAVAEARRWKAIATSNKRP